jgi:hypothetical protein
MPNVDLPPHQRDILVGMWNATYSYNSSGRSTGKTAGQGIFNLLWCITHPGTQILLLGLKFATPRLQVEFMEKVLRENPEAAKCVDLTSAGDFVLHGASEWKLTCKNGSVCKAIPSDINKGGARVRGYRCNILVIDEVAAIPSDIVRTVFIPCCSITDKYGNQKIIQLTTGGYRPSLTWDSCQKHYKGMVTGEIDPRTNKPLYYFANYCYKDVPAAYSHIIDHKAISDMEKSSPADEVAREIYGHWTAYGNNYYNGAMLERNRLYAIEQGAVPEAVGVRGGIYVIGVDPAFRGSDHTALTVLKRIGPRKWVIVASVSLNFKKGWATENAKLVMEYIERFNPVYLGLDRNGGEQLLHELKIYYKDTPDICPIAMDSEPWEQGRLICRQFAPTGTGKDNNTRLNTRMLRALDGNGTPELMLPGADDEDTGVEAVIEMDKLQTQLLSIQASPIEAQPGLFRFSSTMKKDRYSALLYAWNAAEELVEGEYDFQGALGHDTDEDCIAAGAL